MELTVAFMPSARISATTCSIRSTLRCANSLWSTAMSVIRPALSRASVVPGTSRSTRCATSARRRALWARVASSCAYSVCSAAPCMNSATAPFSATMASIGQSRAKGSLQPVGRPVMAITGRPAARNRANASSASGSMAPSCVSVSSMSVSTPATSASAAPGQSASGRDLSGMAASLAWHGGAMLRP